MILLQLQPLPELLHQRHIIQRRANLVTNCITELLVTLTAVMIAMRQPVPAPENNVATIYHQHLFMSTFSQADCPAEQF